MASDINFAWLVRLRWATISAQIAIIAGSRWLAGLPLPLVPLGVLVGVELAVNVACIRLARAADPRPWWLAAVMAIDVLLFSGLLYFTGGPVNPFSFLYLVPIALAAVTLPAIWTWMLVLLSLGCSAVLFASSQPLPLVGDHKHHMDLHLRGMWLALGIAAAFIVYFLLRVRRALEARDAALAASRVQASRQERLASLATLAAGAAHELATPLATIAVVAKELEREIETRAREEARHAIEDVRLVRRQVERCREILGRMRADAGEVVGEGFDAVPIADLVARAAAAGEGDAARAACRLDLEIDDRLAAARLALPPRAMSQALGALVENARRASPPGGVVTVRVAPRGNQVAFAVTDRGAGIPPDVLKRVGEPFFTTRPVGQGMGLGVFLARAVAERLGGELLIASRPGETTATLVVAAAEGAQP
jgi:two-component system sensor histidine kinase RegB